jgi:hypothetical protein
MHCSKQVRRFFHTVAHYFPYQAGIFFIFYFKLGIDAGIRKKEDG